MTARASHRFIALAEWQVCAALGGATVAKPDAVPPWRDGRIKSANEIEQANFRSSQPMTQIRVPMGLWRVAPKPCQLIWVQEPFVHLEGVRRDKFYEAVLYRADYGPAGGLPPSPADARQRHVKTHVCTADKMWRGASRLTLEVTRVWQREWSYWEIGDREREGFRWLNAVFPALQMDDAFLMHWKRSYRARTGSRHGERPPILMLRFNVHQVNIDQFLKQNRGEARLPASPPNFKPVAA